MKNPVLALSEQAQAFWAKTGAEDSPAVGMSLPQHMLDSAMTAEYLWEHWLAPGSKKWLAGQLALPLAQAKAVFAWLVASHDVGKASPEFAGQLDARNNPDLFGYRQKIVDAGFDFPVDKTSPDRRCPHSVYSQSIIAAWLQQRFVGADSETVQSLAQISGAHHGLPADFRLDADSTRMDKQLLKDARPGRPLANWWQVWDELLTFVLDYTGAEPGLGRILAGGALAAEAQFFMTGATIMADWIASNPDFFPYGRPLDQQQRFAAAVARLDLPQPWQPLGQGQLDALGFYRQRFAWGGQARLRPMQRVALEAAASVEGAALVCIEAPMGQGKTEAGLIVAEVLAAQAGKSGLMFAAPTQATADALFTRVKQWAKQAAAGSGVVSMFLGHSKAAFNRDFRDMRFSNMRFSSRPIQTFDEEGGQRTGQANVIAHQWFSRKKGVLANFVVGTVDQVLMLALAARHVMLRHLGLGQKVVVIDEVHAYDAYMNVYLQDALFWLGRMGAPVVLMSATLPANLRRQLCAAYARGLGYGGAVSSKNTFGFLRSARAEPAESAGAASSELDFSYPVIHTVSAASRGQARRWEVEQGQGQQAVTVHPVGDSFADLDGVLAALEQDGGCAAVICNTVARAQEVYEHLSGQFAAEELLLVHSRFLAGDRARMEQRLLDALGKKARPGQGRPYRMIVVGTQVIEQSLDIDFDVMVTDFAPVDLILQRMGRLHRHDREGQRPARFAQPICYVRGVESHGDEARVPEFVKVAELIYQRAVLLSSYAVLLPFFEGEALQLPQHISRLVQCAYATDPRLPATWEQAWREAENERLEQVSQSRGKADFFSMGGRPKPTMFDYMANRLQRADKDELQAQAKVRDTDETLEVIVIQSLDGGQTYTPLLPGFEGEHFAMDDADKPSSKLANVLAASTIRLPFQFADRYERGRNMFDQALEELEENYIASWQNHFLLKGQLAMVLDENMECQLAGYRVRYSREYGLQVEKP